MSPYFKLVQLFVLSAFVLLLFPQKSFSSIKCQKFMASTKSDQNIFLSDWRFERKLELTLEQKKLSRARLFPHQTSPNGKYTVIEALSFFSLIDTKTGKELFTNFNGPLTNFMNRKVSNRSTNLIKHAYKRFSEISGLRFTEDSKYLVGFRSTEFASGEPVIFKISDLIKGNIANRFEELDFELAYSSIFFNDINLKNDYSPATETFTLKDYASNFYLLSPGRTLKKIPTVSVSLSVLSASKDKALVQGDSEILESDGHTISVVNLKTGAIENRINLKTLNDNKSGYYAGFEIITAEKNNDIILIDVHNAMGLFLYNLKTKTGYKLELNVNLYATRDILLNSTGDRITMAISPRKEYLGDYNPNGSRLLVYDISDFNNVRSIANHQILGIQRILPLTEDRVLVYNTDSKFFTFDSRTAKKRNTLKTHPTFKPRPYQLELDGFFTLNNGAQIFANDGSKVNIWDSKHVQRDGLAGITLYEGHKNLSYIGANDVSISGDGKLLTIQSTNSFRFVNVFTPETKK